MENFVVQQNANIIDIKGMVSTNSNIDIQLNIGDEITPATMILLSEGSEIVLAFDDGSQQKITYKLDNSESPLTVENLLGDNVINPEEIINTANQSITSIEDIQALIESGEDIELPDTAAGLTLSNGGFSFNRLDRIADETLAQAGYDTTGFDSTFLPPTQPDPLNNAATFAGVPSSDLVDANEVVTTAEDTNVSGNLLTNASSADGTPVITEFTIGGTVFTAGTTATLAEGELTINPDGSYTFVPAPDYNGTVPEVIYTISDGVNTDTSTLNISVTPVSDLVDANEVVSVSEDTPISGNLLTNASSADGTPVITEFTVSGTVFTVDPTGSGTTATLAEGELTINPDGSYTFVPAPDYNGAVPEVVYTISDGVNTDTSTLNISVTPVSDLVDANEVVSVSEDTPISGNLLTNALSADGTPVITEFTIGGTVFTAGTTATLAEGELTINPDGSYTFVPAPDYNGTVPEVIYTISDGVNTDTSTLNISVTPVSDLVDANEVVTTAEDTNVSGNLLTNASSADGTPVITEFTIGGTVFTVDPAGTGTTATLAEGELTINPDGSYTFVPAPDYNGAVPEVVYTISDGVNTDTSTLNISVTPVSDLVDANEVVSVSEDTPISGNLLTNALSADGTPVITEFTIGGTVFTAGTTATLAEGELTINPDGSYTFVPAPDYNGAVPEVIYTISDGVNTDTSTLNISVTPVSDLVDANEVVTTAEDTNVSGNLLTNASSADGTPVITEFTVGGTVFTVDPAGSGTTATLAEGELTINPDGSYTFVPAPDYNGAVPEVIYTISDGVNTDTSTLNISVTPVSDLVDANEVVTTAEDTNVSGNLLTNASSADGTPVITEFTVGGTVFTVDPAGTGTTATLAEGELTINPDGSYTFVPAPDYNGTVPEVIYTISDGVNTDTSTLNISVTPVSDLVDANEVVTTAEDTNVSGNLLTNASSADGTPVITEFTIGGTVFTAGTTATLAEGELTINPDGSYTFVPAPDYNGAVPEVIYTISDGVNTDTSTLNISVTPVSDLVDANEVVSVSEDTPISGNLLTNASSADGTPVITEFTIGGTVFTAGTTATLAEGELTINPDGSYTFVPAPDYNGAVPEVIYTISDGVNTDTSTLNISVTPVSDLVDANEVVTTAEDTNVSGNLLTNASSADGTPVITEFTIGGTVFTAGTTATLAEGELTINPDGSYTFVPAPDYNGTVPEVIYTISDGVNTDTSTLNISVTPVSDLVDANEVVTTAEDTNVSGNLLTNASSADGTPVITEFTIGGTVFTAGTTATLAEGELTINPDGSYTFVPAPDYNGAVPEVVYTISDGVNTDTSTLNISVTPSVNLPPLAENDTFAVNEGETVSGNVISHNDGDGVVDSDGGDGATLTITQVNGANLVFDPSDDGYATIAIQDGILRINAQGDFSYNNSGFTLGSISPSFNYTLSDGSDTDTATVIINVVDTAPIAFADNNYIKLNENTDGNARFSRVKGNVLSLGSSGDVDDTSADGTVTLVKVTYGGIDYVFDAINTSFTIEADFGTFTINNTGYYLYATKDGMDMPLTNVRDTLSYTIQDGDTIKPETDTTTLTINISVPNAAPTPVVAPLFFNDINDVSEISLNKSSTIDTSTLQKVSAIDISNLPENGPINSSDTDAIDFNLDDFIGETSTHSIDQLLSFNNDEKTVDSTRENNTFEISKEQIVLEKDTLALNQQITNGLLNEGATIISDNSAPSTVPHIELDSNELL